MCSPSNLSQHLSGRCQFSLRTAILLVAYVAVLLSLLSWLGKDGLLLAGIVIPPLAVPLFVRGPAVRKVRITIAVVFLADGVAWSVLFPKTWDLLRGDMLDSMLLGVALVGSGALLLAVRKGAVLRVLSIAFLLSALLNISLFNHVRIVAELLRAQVIRPQPQAPISTPGVNAAKPNTTQTLATDPSALPMTALQQ